MMTEFEKMCRKATWFPDKTDKPDIKTMLGWLEGSPLKTLWRLGVYSMTACDVLKLDSPHAYDVIALAFVGHHLGHDWDGKEWK